MAQDSVLLSETLDFEKDPHSTSSSSDPCLVRNLSLSRLNAQAPEFVPRCSSSSSSSTAPSPRIMIPQPPPPGLVHVYPAPPNSPFHVPIQSHHHPHPHPHPHHASLQYHNHQQYHRQYYGGGRHDDHQEVAVQVQKQVPAESDQGAAAHRNGRTEEATQKILNQVEYYFSDVNLATTDHLMRFINKDPEGFVPLSVVASFKKIKALISSNSQLSTLLRSSSKLVVSEDGKKVKRQLPLTELDMEELQSRIVVAENLPEDHCHQNLMKIFSAVGSVKTIRTCPPQVSNSGASAVSRSAKAEGMLFSNKLHAFVEYETVELAEKAVGELNDEGNWRSGLRVRLLLRRTQQGKSAGGGQMRMIKKIGGEGGGGGEVVHQSEEEGCASATISSSSSSSEATAQQTDEKNSSEEHSDAAQHEHHLAAAGGEDHHNQVMMDKDGGGQKKGRNRGRGGKGRGRSSP